MARLRASLRRGVARVLVVAMAFPWPAVAAASPGTPRVPRNDFANAMHAARSTLVPPHHSAPVAALDESTTSSCAETLAEDELPGLSLGTDELWPPDHALVNVGLTVDPGPACLGRAAIGLVVYSDEPDDATGDGSTIHDAQIDAPDLYLRRERQGKEDGRVYLLLATATHDGVEAAACAAVRQLMEEAIVVGVLGRQRAEERGRVAALNPPTLEEPVSSTGIDEPSTASVQPERKPTTSPRPGSSKDDDARLARARAERERQEKYWRGRSASTRGAVKAAEARVRQLEERARRLGPYTPLPDGPACQTGVAPVMGRGVVDLRDSSRGAVTCSSEVLARRDARRVHAELESARADLERKKKALDSLADEARRAGALPGWLR